MGLTLMKTRFGLVLVGAAGEYSGATLPGLGSNWNSTSFCRALVKLNFLGSHGWHTCRSVGAAVSPCLMQVMLFCPGPSDVVREGLGAGQCLLLIRVTT